jgi:copper(I)-binding protein
MRRILLIVLATVIGTAGCAASGMQSESKGTLRLENAWARRAPAMAAGAAGGHAAGGGHGATQGGSGNGAVYVTIVNDGGSADALVSASTDAASVVELHEVVHEGGVMKMRPLPRFAVPAGGRLEMKPGGYHIMLLGLKRDLKPGDTVSVTLTFDKAGRKSVDAPVR